MPHFYTIKKTHTLTIRYLFLVVMLLTCLSGRTFAQGPIITDFSPKQGPIVSTAVTITGTNFDATTANNIVFFGTTQTTVTTASPTSLNVIVPAGATDAAFALVTVRDVAESIFQVATRPGGHGRNYLISSKTYTVSDMGRMLNQQPPLATGRVVYSSALATQELGIPFRPMIGNPEQVRVIL